MSLFHTSSFHFIIYHDFSIASNNWNVTEEFSHTLNFFSFGGGLLLQMQFHISSFTGGNLADISGENIV